MVDKSLKNLIGLQDLPSNAIVDRGRIIGLWEFDALKQEIVWNSFVPADKQLKEVVSATEKFICEQLRDARSFSLDNPQITKAALRCASKSLTTKSQSLIELRLNSHSLDNSGGVLCTFGTNSTITSIFR